MATKADITPEVCRQLLDYDPATGVLTWRRREKHWFANQRSWARWNTKHAGKVAFTTVKQRRGRAVCFIGTILSTPQKAHRVAWAIHYGKWPDNEIDHEDGNPLRNVISNLRDVTHEVNCKNLAVPSDNTSGAVGVALNRRTRKWTVLIKADKRTKYVGEFADFEDAVSARKAAQIEQGYHPNHATR